jgi:hypothetical protein
MNPALGHRGFVTETKKRGKVGPDNAKRDKPFAIHKGFWHPTRKRVTGRFEAAKPIDRLESGPGTGYNGCHWQFLDWA